MLRYFVIYKPYEVLSQFSPEGDKRTLKDCFDVPADVYPVGRLDHDSEGLLILTNDKGLNAALLQPEKAHERTYWVQVEGDITASAIKELATGVEINVNGKLHRTLPAKAHKLEGPVSVPDRHPPIRYRAAIPTSWISLGLTEGKNRQVRRMTARVGYPTLRLIRYSIGKLTIDGMQPGDCREMDQKEIYWALFGKEALPRPRVRTSGWPNKPKRQR
ncbi:pseudouridine synthase [Flavihumibacter rivuli]|uniref:pseudouridine synthase n=1 Tax=Flavihumibacter rivuli TaxID=2838156 RepID=UPI001BDE015B|nr:pseudouridine synthase [Flavihumibacter rivuli]ULQ56126.1 pseudouridine synthase [Flavihumibacter rivuli]